MGFIKGIIKAILRDVFGLEVFWARNLPQSPVQEATMQLVSSLCEKWSVTSNRCKNTRSRYQIFE